MSPADLRKRWRAYFDRCEAIRQGREAAERLWMKAATAAREGRGPWPPSLAEPAYPPFPDELRGLPCGARTRKGQPCKRTDLGRNGRCKFHGGMSTGPKTATGRARAIGNLALGRVKRNGVEPHG